MTRIAIWLTCCFAVSMLGCSNSDPLTNTQREKLAKYVGKQETKPQHPLDIKFDDKISLIGYDASTDKVTPGTPFTVTWHFRVDKAPGESWRLFTHLADATDKSRVNADSNGPIRGFFPVSKWEAGTFVRDEQSIVLPDNWRSDRLIVYLGVWKDGARMDVKGPSDGKDRARALELPVMVKQVELPVLHAAFVEAPAPKKPPAIKLDGKLDEPAWAAATPTPQFVNTMNGEPAEPKVTTRALWSPEFLYVAFGVADDHLKSTFEKDDDHLWEQDCVEIMVDPDGDGKNYVELQVSPANKKFDTRYETRRQPKPFGHMDYASNLTSGVEVRGKLNDEEGDQGYVAEIAIPWSAFAQGEPKHEPPKAGDTWRINFYVMDAREKGIRAVGWSPPRVGDFHTPKQFGKIVFDAPAVAPPAVAEPAVSEKPADKKTTAAAEKPASKKAAPAAEKAAKAPEAKTP